MDRNHLPDIHNILDLKLLDSQFGLYKPDSHHSITGIMPTLLQHWNKEVDIPNKTVIHSALDREMDIYENVILVIADGLGMNQVKTKSELIAKNIEEFELMASSTFPSMTATAMTSIFYGVSPSIHGILGHNIYNEHLDKIWHPLRMRYRNGNEIRQILNEVDLSQLVSGKSLTDQVYTSNAESISVLTPDYLKPPGLGNILNPVLPRIPFSDHKNAMKKISHILNGKNSSQYIVLYLPDIDTSGHKYGPNSRYTADAINQVERLIQQLLTEVQSQNQSTAIVLMSDHGQVDINQHQSSIMNQSQWEYYRRNGTLLCSSGRVIYGYSTDNDTESTYNHLIEIAQKQGIVITKEQAIHLAGGDPTFQQRMGDYALIYGKNYLHGVSNTISIDQDPLPKGQHGSLTLDELVVPIALFES